MPAAPCSASIAFFTNDSSAHSSSTGSPSTVGPAPAASTLSSIGLACSRQPGPEIAGHPVGQRAEPDRLALGRIADPLEALRHAIEAFGIGRQVIGQIRAAAWRGSEPARSSPAGW